MQIYTYLWKNKIISDFSIDKYRDSGVRIQVSGFRNQESGVRIQVSGFRCQESGIRNQV
jgi:hypothetical protein